MPDLNKETSEVGKNTQLMRRAVEAAKRQDTGPEALLGNDLMQAQSEVATKCDSAWQGPDKDLARGTIGELIGTAEQRAEEIAKKHDGVEGARDAAKQAVVMTLVEENMGGGRSWELAAKALGTAPEVAGDRDLGLEVVRAVEAEVGRQGPLELGKQGQAERTGAVTLLSEVRKGGSLVELPEGRAVDFRLGQLRGVGLSERITAEGWKTKPEDIGAMISAVAPEVPEIAPAQIQKVLTEEFRLTEVYNAGQVGVVLAEVLPPTALNRGVVTGFVEAEMGRNQPAIGQQDLGEPDRRDAGAKTIARLYENSGLSLFDGGEQVTAGGGSRQEQADIGRLRKKWKHDQPEVIAAHIRVMERRKGTEQAQPEILADQTAGVEAARLAVAESVPAVAEKLPGDKGNEGVPKTEKKTGGRLGGILRIFGGR